ncbi:MAG: glutamine--fructose-6-phosphate transaminase (isomerizing) [Candidatus Diapherotrites archaeon]|uniref:Glutamine--fructose-6-phosphate aminotransferase [isomerizing] n=1 Tax=Candidatus Iainarchaeum sp. TaxID=3101447 RepID=A0A938YRC2_9ARCH|nr:glutamine--fructose-6-phosphate transaminase (isomerizing) [Candidatus Diapherotrites archaeon]
MCGIVAYKGKGDAVAAVLSGLKQLEYRGYDSWGIAALNKGGIALERSVGRIGGKQSVNLPKSNIAIGHTRWATHGGVTKENAHPHFDCKGKIAVAHNGIIENFAELRDSLRGKGHKFKSETDSEVIAHLIEEESKGGKGFEEAVSAALPKLHGSFAIAALDSESGNVIGARKNSPLVVGFNGDEHFLASDVTAFLEHTNKVAFLLDNELVVLNKEASFKNFFLGKAVKKKIETINWKPGQVSKSGFKHFMLKEIMQQPDKVRATMQGRLLPGGVKLKEIDEILAKASSFNRIVLVGCGTAYHAGMVAEYLFEELCKLPVETEYASEFRYRQPVIDERTLVIAISQSGETADTLAAVREAKAGNAKVLSIINVQGSTIARESDFVLYLNAGPEIGVASTKAFTCQLTALAMIAIAFASKLGKVGKARVASLAGSLKMLPGQIEEVLEQRGLIEQIAKRYFEKRNALFLGRGVNFPIALEGALKLKEISYVHAEAMPAAEMKHGPIALIDSEMPVVFLAVNDKSYGKILGNIQEVKARGGKVIAIANKGNKELQSSVDETIFVAKTDELLQPLLNVVPLQLFAYFVADLRGCDIDKPRNLAKSVTVE